MKWYNDVLHFRSNDSYRFTHTHYQVGGITLEIRSTRFMALSHLFFSFAVCKPFFMCNVLIAPGIRSPVENMPPKSTMHIQYIWRMIKSTHNLHSIEKDLIRTEELKYSLVVNTDSTVFLLCYTGLCNEPPLNSSRSPVIEANKSKRSRKQLNFHLLKMIGSFQRRIFFRLPKIWLAEAR